MSSGDVPVIETQRLRMRGHRPDDFADCAAMWMDPVVTRFVGGKPSTEQQTWARVLAYVGHWTFLGFGYWAIEERETGAFIGELGFADFKRDVPASVRDVPELGWALLRRMHGRGYATEAVRGVLAWGDVHIDARRTVCLIDARNAASIRVAQKCGYREVERGPYNGRLVLFFGRERGSSDGAA